MFLTFKKRRKIQIEIESSTHRKTSKDKTSCTVQAGGVGDVNLGYVILSRIPLAMKPETAITLSFTKPGNVNSGVYAVSA